MKRGWWISGVMLALLVAAPLAVAQPASPVATPDGSSTPFGSLRFIGEQRISNLASVDFTLVGGLSGLDYDPGTDTWVLISDDRSGFDLARFYTAELELGAEGFTGVSITGQTTLLQADGAPYLPAAGSVAPNLESIRFDPVNHDVIWWVSEADGFNGLEPRIVQANIQGLEIGEITPHPIFALDPDGAAESARSSSFEGFTFSTDGETIWVANETAVVQDGPVSTVDAGAISRFTQYDRDGNVVAQYAYQVDPIQAVPTGDGADNGVSEILAIDATRFLVVERSGVSTAAGPWNLYIRVYLIDTTGATDVQEVESLVGAEFTPVSKSLVLNLAETDLPRVDNIEGISWGPTLPNGNRTLVFVSDNNFNLEQVTQFLAFEVVP